MRRCHMYRIRAAKAARANEQGAPVKGSARREKDQVLQNILEPAIGSGKREEDGTSRSFFNNVLSTALTVKAKAQTAAAVVEAKAPGFKAAAVAAAAEVVVQMKNPLGNDKGERGRSVCDAIVVDDKMVDSICALGFSADVARLALTRSKGNVDVACNLLFEATERTESSQRGCTHDKKNIGCGSVSRGMNDHVGSDSSPPSRSSGSVASTTASSSATLSPEEYLDLVQDGSSDEEECAESNASHSKFSGRWLANNGMQPLIFGSDVNLGDGIHARVVFQSENSLSMKLDGETHHADVEENRMVWSNGDVWVRLACRVTHSPRAESCDSDDDGCGSASRRQSWTALSAASPKAIRRDCGGGEGDAKEAVAADCEESPFELEGKAEVFLSAESEACGLAVAMPAAKGAKAGEGESPRSDESVPATVTFQASVGGTSSQSALVASEDSVQTASSVLTVIAESVECKEEPCLPSIKGEEVCQDDNRHELEAGFSSDGVGAWEWPLSRKERKSRVYQMERHMQMLDRRTLMQELVELRLLSKRQRDIVECMTLLPQF